MSAQEERSSPKTAPPRWSTSSSDAVSVLSDGGIHPELPSLLPLSHDHPMLSSSSEKWDVDEFLLTRLHIPLEELRGELREYLGVLKEELGGLINDDYEEFISLGLGLRGEGTRLENLKYPLQALKVEVQDIHSQLESSESALQSRLDDRSSLRAERAILDTLLHLSESLTRTEGLLGIESSEASQSSGASKTPEKTVDPPIPEGKPRLAVIIDASEDEDEPKDIKTISRIASEYTQVMYLVEKARAEGCEYVTADEGAVEQRIETIRQALFLNLERVLSSTIGRRKHSTPQVSESQRRILSNCLEVYNTIQGWRQAEQVVKTIVEQDLRDIVTARYLSTAPSPAIPATPFGMQETNPMSPALMTPHTPMTMTSTMTKSMDANPFEASLSPKDGGAPSRMREAKLLDETDNPIAIILNNVLRYVDENLLDLLMLGERIRDKQQSKSKLPQPKDYETGSENGDGLSQTDENNDDPESTFEFMANSIWTPVAELIISELGGVLFANGRVTELHQNYTLAHQFVEQLESLAMSVPAVVALRSTDAYQSFEKKWQLPVYFQLRWKEIVKELEEGLTIGSGGITAEQGRDGFALPQTAAVFVAFKSCWAPNIYIPELGFRFWRLALQIISRYRTFIEASVPALYETAVQPTTSRSSINLPRPSLSLTGPTLPTGDPSSDAASAQAEDQILKAASVIASDLSKIHKDVSAFWGERVEHLLQRTLVQEEVKKIQTTLDHSLSALSALFAGPSDHIISILTRRCTDQLKLVRSIASQLRTLTPAQFKETPKPSHFIPNILKPLEDYFGKNGYGQGLMGEVGSVWSRKVIEEVLTAYTSILVSVQKTEDLLRRHRKGKKSTFSLFGSASNASAVSIEEEEERFKQQMIIDIKAFGKASENLGVLPESPEQGELAGWKALLETAERNTTA